MIQAWDYLHALHALAAKNLLNGITDRLFNFWGHRVVLIKLLGEGRNGGWAAKSYFNCERSN